MKLITAERNFLRYIVNKTTDLTSRAVAVSTAEREENMKVEFTPVFDLMDGEVSALNRTLQLLREIELLTDTESLVNDNDNDIEIARAAIQYILDNKKAKE